jgi:dolichol-phosphate mannosyltransferase
MAEPAPNLDVSVVVPTYNEAENVPVIVPRICEVLEKAGIRGEIIVVDDGSPDGTGRVAQGLSDIYPVRVLVRSGERGLATAVVAGFGMSTARVCVVMDADGSHPAEKLPDMIRPILEDRADITVGSRNIEGGGAENWPWHRRVVSKTASLMAAGLCKLSDPTSGFMGVKRQLLAGLKLNPVGYKIVLETVVKSAPARVLEVPIVFMDRQLGQSKLGPGQQVNYIRHLYRLHQHRRPTLFEFFKFCLVGFSGIFVDMAVVIGLKELFHVDTRICAIFGFATAVTTNYLLNRYWSFARGRFAPVVRSYLVFVAVCCVGLAVRLGVIHLLIEYTMMDTGRWYILTNFIGIMVATAVNFTGSKLLAFRPGKKSE